MADARAETIAKEIGHPLVGFRVEAYIKLIRGEPLAFRNETINWANSLSKRDFAKLDRRVTALLEE